MVVVAMMARNEGVRTQMCAVFTPVRACGIAMVARRSVCMSYEKLNKNKYLR
jgi:hypothetical protein